MIATAGIVERPSPNANDRPTGVPVDMLVLHYTGMVSGISALTRLCDPDAKVSAHYLVDEDGTVYRLVPEEKRAWHAGLACWRGERDVNGRSVGIELVNPGHAFGYRDFPASQMAALTRLARDILARHPIPPRNVVGHSDIAPDRKLDPGERFDWRGLAARGIGLWPATPQAVAGGVLDLLAEYGYDTTARQAIAAFQRHFRPARIDGVDDDETLAMLGGAVAAIREAA
jgi:N-acetylmuramoyl-L-alanine amidase